MRKGFFSEKIGIFSMVLFVIAVLCVAYFILIAVYTGLGSRFHFVWLGIAAVLVLFGILFSLHHMEQIHIPNAVLILLGVVFLVAAIAFGTAEALIISSGHAKPTAGAKYMIVLGTRVDGSQITLPLKYRLDAAIEYANQSPETQMIVTGAQGDGEDLTEAEAMYDYLTDHGIHADRIICEKRAENTEENILYSMELMEDPVYDRAVIVTNRFHIYRALHICEKQGMEKVQGLGAPNHLITIPSLYLREGIAVLKYKLTGQI